MTQEHPVKVKEEGVGGGGGTPEPETQSFPDGILSSGTTGCKLPCLRVTSKEREEAGDERRGKAGTGPAVRMNVVSGRNCVSVHASCHSIHDQENDLSFCRIFKNISSDGQQKRQQRSRDMTYAGMQMNSWVGTAFLLMTSPSPVGLGLAFTWRCGCKKWTVK